MTSKEKFLQIDTYEEFDRRRGEFKDFLLSDREVLEHVAEIFPKTYAGTDELYRIPKRQGGVIGDGLVDGLDSYWTTNRDWWIRKDNGLIAVCPDAPKEARESYNRYLHQLRDKQGAEIIELLTE